MTNPGSDNPEENNTRPVPLRILFMGLVAVLLALVIGTQVIPVLFSVFFPPQPPIPDNATLVSHTSEDRGADQWVYRASQSACDAVKFFQGHGGICQIASECNPLPESALLTTRISSCTGQITYSAFAMRWQAEITPDGDQSEINLSRQVFWSGVVPTTTP
jgi:hypothetical protein